MIKNNLTHKSLGVIVLSNFILVATIIAALGTLLVFSGSQNTKSIQALNDLDSKYDYALALEEAVDNLAYFSAEMSNTLSDESLDEFQNASSQASLLISELSDVNFQQALLEHKSQIETNALLALDSYIIDDRSAGDGHMAAVRSSTAQIKNLMNGHVDGYKSMRERETENIAQRTRSVENLVKIVASISGIIVLISALQMWKALFSPIQMLIKSISGAAEDTNHAANYQIKNLPNNEIGVAGHALNHLLTEVSSALSEARNRTEEARNAEQKWKALFDGSPDAIIIMDPENSEILEDNRSAQNLLCLNDEDINPNEKMTGSDFHHHELDAFNAFLKKIRSDGFARSDSLSCAIGEERIPVSVVGVTAVVENDVAFMMHIRDISEQRRHEVEISEALIAAERANVAKSNFLANMSHEIRTPMNGVIGMAEVLASTKLDERQKELVAIIVSSGSNLITVINDILDFSKLEAGKMQLSPQGFKLRKMVEDVGHLLNACAVDKGIDLVTEYSKDLPDNIIADESRLRQILINIVGNAVKFTERGQVKISVKGIRQGQDLNLRIEVSDTGIGITETDIPRMFEKFEQADGSRARKHDGTGLGLAISKELIELMDGEIGVRSTPNEGSTFWIKAIVPLDEDAEEQSDIEISPFIGIRVLAIEENSDNQAVLRDQMDESDVRLEICNSFDDGLVALKQGQQSCDRYHLLLIGDGTAGVESFKHKLQSERVRQDIPAILVSYGGDKDDASQDHDYLKKKGNPIPISKISDAMVQALNDSAVANLKVTASRLSKKFSVERDENIAAENLTDKKSSYEARPVILVAEDNLVNQLVIKSMIPGDLYEIVITENGAEAFEKFKILRPDIVIMDLSMPVMDGYEASQAIRNHEVSNGWHRTPIIAATAHALPEDRERCQAMGMDDFLAKPIRKPVIEEVLARWLSANKLEKRA